MDYFKKYNNLTGWLVFAVSLAVYIMTAEPAASWWDCMEFTATSYKLEVGHPPGAPLFMIIMRLFTMLSLGDTVAVGFASNLMSCMASAFCILFMFWTITRLARKMYGGGAAGAGNGDAGQNAEFDPGNKTHTWMAIGAGVIGSLAYAFSDTFWFSAVESEVYALSSMFTALVVWLMMRWEEVADEPRSTRWLILIAYMMGLSIGVHILNLLTIPALVFIYYFRKTPQVTRKGVVYALLAAGGIVLAIYKVIMPWTVSIGAWWDRAFVNSLGLPVNSGMVVWVLVLFALVGLGVWYTHKKGKVLWNTVLLCTAVILVGYSSYASVVIRSSVNPPMNSNRPDNAYALLSLMNRDQYGSAPMLYGPSYASAVVETKFHDTWFLDENGKYQKKPAVLGYEFAPGSEMLFPRIWDSAAAGSYRSWLNLKANATPTGGDNLRFFFGYQLNFMYWRYFMWNFVGRQDDIQGRGDILHGNWLSGINFIDQLYLGPQDSYVKGENGEKIRLLPEEVERNPGRNKFFFLPFLLGILGLIAQLGKDRRGFTIVMWLFVMMGVVLVVYFNISGAARERDYIYAGSFYAFSIWIGLGVLWIQEIVAKLFRRECWVSAAVATAVCALVPTLMAAQGWDDHDRSGRYIGHDFGHNELVSTLPNSIIMNFGDNDTFPLWYNQEVENLRPDVRIMNMSYIGADWYIDQMRHAYNDSAPVPLGLSPEVYRDNDQTFVDTETTIPLPIKLVVDFVGSRDRNHRMQYDEQTWYDYLPTRTLVIPVNKENAIASGIVKPEDAHLMVDSIEFTLPESFTTIMKPQLVLLDLLAHFDWSRPLFTTYPQLFRELGLGEWLQADGWAYRFVPIKTPENALTVGRVDSELTYDLLMNKYKYGNAGKPGVYVDYYSVINLQFVSNYNTFIRLANQLIDEDDRARAAGTIDSLGVETPKLNKRARAVEVLDRALTEYPLSKFDYDERYGISPIYFMIGAYYAAGAFEKGDALLEDYANTLQEYIEYYLRFEGRKADLVARTWSEKFQYLDALASLASIWGRTAQYEAIDSYLDMFGPAEEEVPASAPAPVSPIDSLQ